MKKNMMLAMAVLFIISVVSCNKQSPAEPEPASTPVSTSTITPTQSVTASASPTVTATATSTSVVIMLQDAEANNNLSAVVCSGCTNTITFWNNPGGVPVAYGPGPISGNPMFGSYYYSLTGTVTRDNSTMIGLNIPVKVTPGAGVAVSTSAKLEFYYMAKASTGIKMYINLWNEVPSLIYLDYNLALVQDGIWYHVSVPLSSMGGYNAADVAKCITAVVFGVSSTDNSGALPPAYIEFSFDNIRLVE